MAWPRVYPACSFGNAYADILILCWFAVRGPLVTWYRAHRRVSSSLSVQVVCYSQVSVVSCFPFISCHQLTRCIVSKKCVEREPICCLFVGGCKVSSVLPPFFLFIFTADRSPSEKQSFVAHILCLCFCSFFFQPRSFSLTPRLFAHPRPRPRLL